MLDMDELDDELRAARQAFLKASSVYDIRGTQLEGRCIQHIERYVDPEEDRAPELKEPANEVIRLIRQFTSTHATLTSDVALIGMALESYALRLKSAAVRETFSKLASETTASFEDYEAAASWAAELAVKSIELATRCLELRTSVLAEYLGERDSSTMTEILDAMLGAASGVAREKVKEAAIITLLPGSQFFFAALAYMRDVRDRVRKIRSYRGRGADDDMFDFRRALQEQTTLFESLRSAIYEDHKVLMAEICAT